jgi:hypothetical protein
MTRLNVNDARCEALFASALQRTDAPAPEALGEVISRTVRKLGIAGCAARMAQEFGDHPEAAASRMRWIRQLIGELYAPAAGRPARSGGWPPTPASGPRAARPATGSARRAA